MGSETKDPRYPSKPSGAVKSNGPLSLAPAGLTEDIDDAWGEDGGDDNSAAAKPSGSGSPSATPGKSSSLPSLGRGILGSGSKPPGGVLGSKPSAGSGSHSGSSRTGGRQGRSPSASPFGTSSSPVPISKTEAKQALAPALIPKFGDTPSGSGPGAESSLAESSKATESKSAKVSPKPSAEPSEAKRTEAEAIGVAETISLGAARDSDVTIERRAVEAPAEEDQPSAAAAGQGHEDETRGSEVDPASDPATSDTASTDEGDAPHGQASGAEPESADGDSGADDVSKDESGLSSDAADGAEVESTGPDIGDDDKRVSDARVGQQGSAATDSGQHAATQAAARSAAADEKRGASPWIWVVAAAVLLGVVWLANRGGDDGSASDQQVIQPASKPAVAKKLEDAKPEPKPLETAPIEPPATSASASADELEPSPEDDGEEADDGASEESADEDAASSAKPDGRGARRRTGSAKLARGSRGVGAPQADDSASDTVQVQLVVEPLDTKVGHKGIEVHRPYVFELSKGEKIALELALSGYVTRRVVLDGTQAMVRVGMRPLKPSPATEAPARTPPESKTVPSKNSTGSSAPADL